MKRSSGKKLSPKQSKTVAKLKQLTSPKSDTLPVEPAPISQPKKPKLSAKDKQLKSKVQASAAREKQIAKDYQKRKKATGPIRLNEMSPDEQKAILFNSFPGEQMGIVVGKADPNDPYNALLPKESK